MITSGPANSPHLPLPPRRCPRLCYFSAWLDSQAAAMRGVSRAWLINFCEHRRYLCRGRCDPADAASGISGSLWSYSCRYLAALRLNGVRADLQKLVWAIPQSLTRHEMGASATWGDSQANFERILECRLLRCRAVPRFRSSRARTMRMGGPRRNTAHCGRLLVRASALCRRLLI